MDIKISVWEDRNGINNEDTFSDKNREVLTTFFNGDGNVNEVSFINEVPVINCHEVYEDLSAVCKYILTDLYDNDSSLSRYLQNSVSISDKTEGFIYILDNAIIPYIIKPAYSQDLQSWDAFYGNKQLHFRAYLNDTRGPWQLLLGEVYTMHSIAVDEFMAGVLLQYYMEITAWDREALRNDEVEMSYLHESWIESLRFMLA